MTEWRKGMKAVCVDAGLFKEQLQNGRVYTVSAVGEFEDDLWLGMEETTGHSPVHWRASRFRPVVERGTETGMATLREIADRETMRPSPQTRCASRRGSEHMVEWQPIETAPKTGKEVIVLIRPKVIRLGWYFQPSSHTGGWCDENGRRIHPKHWMPLPAPPEGSA